MNKKILFVDGTKGFNPGRLSNNPCGGIITSLTLIPQILMKHGYDVYVASEYGGEFCHNGIFYVKDIDADIPDIVVFNRNTLCRKYTNYFKKAKKVWWLHDIVQPFYLEDSSFKDVDKIVALSEYCAMSYSDFYSFKKEIYEIIPNGVDKTIFYPGDYKKRNKNLYIVASAPVKGLYPLLFTLHNLKRQNPDIELRIYSSQKLHDFEDDPKHKKQLNDLRENGAVIKEPIKQRELAQVMREAWCLLMPNSYPEICSNLLLQAMACGLPTVTVPIGSQPEYILHEITGLSTFTHPHDLYWWYKDYALQAIRYQRELDLHKKISENSPKKIKSWKEIGDAWIDMLRRL